MVDKLERLSGLLSGQRVQLSDKSFTASSHPLGVLYCTYLIAKKFVVSPIYIMFTFLAKQSLRFGAYKHFF
jgi:hypothetical protein